MGDSLDNCCRIQLYKGESSPRALEIICEDNQERQYGDPSESAELENNEAITQKNRIEYSEEEGEESDEEGDESGDNWEDSDCDCDNI